MNNYKKRSFRPRQQKSGFRRRSNGSTQSQNGHFQNNNGNNNFNRNGSMSNPFNVEKAIQKFQQLAKDAQSSGDLVLVENYLQHADHYARRLSELNSRVKSTPVETNSPIIENQSEKGDKQVDETTNQEKNI